LNGVQEVESSMRSPPSCHDRSRNRDHRRRSLRMSAFSLPPMTLAAAASGDQRQTRTTGTPTPSPNRTRRPGFPSSLSYSLSIPTSARQSISTFPCGTFAATLMPTFGGVAGSRLRTHGAALGAEQSCERRPAPPTNARWRRSVRTNQSALGERVVLAAVVTVSSVVKKPLVAHGAPTTVGRTIRQAEAGGPTPAGPGFSHPAHPHHHHELLPGALERRGVQQRPRIERKEKGNARREAGEAGEIGDGNFLRARGER
jgi:hypothetical protein